ncbi:MAG: amidohydrolase family protein [Planctomycetota bacterium]|jgi:putative selenium metabolism protein SsnA
MTPVTLTNAILLDLDPPRACPGGVRVEGGQIAAVGDAAVPAGAEAIHDCGGAVVLPGLVNAHTHLYSALAVGMPPPAEPPQNFLEILQRVWWKLDLALDERAIEASAVIGAIEALRCGTTTLIDHHASPNCVGGSLDLVERGLERAGLRGVLCYEVTDRHGPDGRRAGLNETARYLDRCTRRGDGRFAGLVGAHALFTLEDSALDALAELTREFDTGLHIHLAEDACDEEACNAEHQMFLLDRLKAHGLLQPAALFAHGTHVGDDDIMALSRTGCTVVHNSRSNMNNSVGHAPVHRLLGSVPLALGTDGIGSDMLAEAKAAYFKAHDQGISLGPAHVVAMLAASARRASQALDTPLGRLEAGYAADLVVTDYVPPTPITDDNAPGHALFGLDARHVKDVMIGGQWRLKDRRVVGLDEAAERRAASEVAADLWQRM